MITVPRKTLAALVCVALGTLDHGFAVNAQTSMPACAAADALCQDRLHGRVVENADAFGAATPSSSEAENATLKASGLAPSELRRMRADAATPAPVAPSQVSAELDDKARANFVSGRADLTAAATASLDLLAAKLSGYDISRAIVVGHTDSERISARLKPVYADNQALSEARAAAVAGYLKQKLQLDASAFSIIGKGLTEPLVSNDSPAGMAKNRRVLIQIWATRKLAVGVAEPVAQPLCGAADGTTVAQPTAAQPFQTSIDGTPQDGQAPAEADRQRCVDVALASDEVQVRFDPMELAPALNAWAADGSERDQPVVFRSWSNYSAWIKHAEIRIFAKGSSTQQTPLAVVPVTLGSPTPWLAPTGTPDDLFYACGSATSRAVSMKPRPQRSAWSII